MTSGKGKKATNKKLDEFVCPPLENKTPMNCLVPTTEEFRFFAIAVASYMLSL